MGDRQITLWHQGHVIDLFSRPRRPFVAVVCALLFVLLIDALIGIALDSGNGDGLEPESAGDVSALIRRMKSLPKDQHPWLLVGDSVLVGNVMSSRITDWQDKRVIDYLRREISPASGDRFEQVALDGMLPVDMVRVVRELDRVDPGGRIGLVVEINPRYFSPSYQSQSGTTRAWLEALAPSRVGKDGYQRLATFKDVFTQAGDWLARHAPVYRHARRLTARPMIGNPADFAPPIRSKQDGDGRPDRLEAQARILEHYRSPRFDESGAQVQALQEIHRRLADSARRSFVFNTPLNDDFMAGAMAEPDYGEYVSRVSGMLSGEPGGHPKVLNLDSPLFMQPWFVDHCHMLPEGNRVLAVNLLHELNAGLAEVPDRGTIIYPEGIDDPLVWRIGQGYSNGAAWQAMFNDPEGIELTDSGRLVIADTRNHCMRVMAGNHQTVALLAGRPAESGGADGPADAARFESPKAVASIGETVFVSDLDGARLRRVGENGDVLTEFTAEGPPWFHIETLRKSGGVLYIHDRDGRIIAFDPVARTTRLVAQSVEGESINTFDVAPDGRIWIATGGNQIFRGRLNPSGVIHAGQGTKDMELWFANEGTAGILPPRIDFPMPFEKVKFARLVDLRYVERYDGILIRDDQPIIKMDNLVPTPRQLDVLTNEKITERISLRFLRTADSLIYPWIKANFYTKYFLENIHTVSQTTSFHLGSMALNQKTGSMYYLERERSRLSRYGDGIWATAREGNGISEGVVDIQPGVKCAQHVLTTMNPDFHLHQRDERIERKGPYLGLFLCTSMMGLSEIVPGYSGSRLLEMRLREMLGYKDGIRFDLIGRVTYGMKAKESVEIFESYVNSGVKVDVAFIEFFSDEHQQLYTIQNRNPNGDKVTWGHEYLERIERAAKKYDTKVFFLDHSGLIGQPGDGLRKPHRNLPAFFQIARDAGFRVIDANDDLLRDHLEITPWASPPFWRWHAAPWAIEATVFQDAKRLYPFVREHLLGRVPAIDRPDAKEGGPEGVMLSQALKDLKINPQALGLVPIDLKAIHKTYADRRLGVFVDLAGVPSYKADPDGRNLALVTLSLLQQLLGGGDAESRAVEMELTLATFTNYDEYGLGVRDSARIIERRTMRHPELVEYIKAALGKLAPAPATTPAPK